MRSTLDVVGPETVTLRTILEDAGGRQLSDADITKELRGAEKEANALLAAPG